MKGYFFILMMLNLLNCNAPTMKIEDSKNTGVKSEKRVKDDKHGLLAFLNDSLPNRLIRSNIKWFNSWNWDKDSLRTSNFELRFTKALNLSWENYDPKNSHFKQYDSLLIYYNNELALDLYSYNTFINLEGKGVLVSFDVDSKIYIVNKIKSVRAEVLTSGSYEIIEDGLWLSDKKIALLGYHDENEEKNIPFLWVIDIESKKIFGYYFSNSFSDKRKNYFFIKYPNMKLRDQ